MRSIKDPSSHKPLSSSLDAVNGTKVGLLRFRAPLKDEVRVWPKTVQVRTCSWLVLRSTHPIESQSQCSSYSPSILGYIVNSLWRHASSRPMWFEMSHYSLRRTTPRPSNVVSVNDRHLDEASHGACSHAHDRRPLQL